MQILSSQKCKLVAGSSVHVTLSNDYIDISLEKGESFIYKQDGNVLELHANGLMIINGNTLNTISYEWVSLKTDGMNIISTLIKNLNIRSYTIS